MIGKTERVILVKGDATKWYEQAIFIVNTNMGTEQMPIDFVAEAEKIINDYNLTRGERRNLPIVITPPARLDTKQGTDPNYKKSKANYLLGFLMIIASIIIAAIFVFGVMR